jgi:hypothetical protein
MGTRYKDINSHDLGGPFSVYRIFFINNPSIRLQFTVLVMAGKFFIFAAGRPPYRSPQLPGGGKSGHHSAS